MRFLRTLIIIITIIIIIMMMMMIIIINFERYIYTRELAFSRSVFLLWQSFRSSNFYKHSWLVRSPWWPNVKRKKSVYLAGRNLQCFVHLCKSVRLDLFSSFSQFNFKLFLVFGLDTSLLIVNGVYKEDQAKLIGKKSDALVEYYAQFCKLMSTNTSLDA